MSAESQETPTPDRRELRARAAQITSASPDESKVALVDAVTDLDL